jgi:hypothetical protein
LLASAWRRALINVGELRGDAHAAALHTALWCAAVAQVALERQG